jgi:peptidoglycan/xylan/chitin deacetylase (PgdA/CDA1 family)
MAAQSDHAVDRKLPVLMYHHVGPASAGEHRDVSITPEKFERHIQCIKRWGYETIWPSDWLEWLRSGKALPRKPVLITFDDAYVDTAKFAFPLLRKYGKKAAVFVVTEQVGGTNLWDELNGLETLHLMSAEEIRRWADANIEFGAHSCTHADLTTISAEELRAEVEGSKRELEAIIGKPVVSFAYPFGKQSEQVRAVVAGCFDLAFGAEEGLNYLRTDRSSLKRVYVGSGTLAAEIPVALRSGKLDWIHELRRRLGLRTRFRQMVKAAKPS